MDETTLERLENIMQVALRRAANAERDAFHAIIQARKAGESDAEPTRRWNGACEASNVIDAILAGFINLNGIEHDHPKLIDEIFGRD